MSPTFPEAVSAARRVASGQREPSFALFSGGRRKGRAAPFSCSWVLFWGALKVLYIFYMRQRSSHSICPESALILSKLALILSGIGTRFVRHRGRESRSPAWLAALFFSLLSSPPGREIRKPRNSRENLRFRLLTNLLSRAILALD
jgi:hypothetical protein